MGTYVRRLQRNQLIPKSLVFGLLWAIFLPLITAKVQSKVRCTPDWMEVDIVKSDDFESIYLEQLKDYPDPACRPEENEVGLLTFRLSLQDIFRCGTTRIVNQLTGRKTYVHRIILEHRPSSPLTKEMLMVKCHIGNGFMHLPRVRNQSESIVPLRRLRRQNGFPVDFKEPEDLEITTSLTEVAPEPILNVGVRQGGQLVTGELNVNPGTPLRMEINLDPSSAPVYGLLVREMFVTDTQSQEETIIVNGCSVDPYLFENFNTVDGDFLSAKFRAFKFPDSNYVLFKGTVSVCLDKCQGIPCRNGQIGYGRRRREVKSEPADLNKIFEVTMTTFIKVEYEDDKLVEKATLLGQIKGERQHNLTEHRPNLLGVQRDEVREEVYTLVEEDVVGGAPAGILPTLSMCALTLLVALINRFLI